MLTAILISGTFLRTQPTMNIPVWDINIYKIYKYTLHITKIIELMEGVFLVLYSVPC